MDLQATFRCGVCGQEAGRVRLYAPGEPIVASERAASQALSEVDRVARPRDQAALVVETFYGVESHPVFPERMERLIEAIRAGDGKALYGITYAYAPFHCPDCASEYCGSHWTWKRFEDDYHSGVDGRCPRGHFHVLMY